MIFKKISTNEITNDILKECLLKGTHTEKILNLHFKGFDHISTLDNAISIIEDKRITLQNPYAHTFLCLELKYDESTTSQTMIASTNKVADALNAYFL